MRVLIVEDDETSRCFLESVFQDGNEVVSATDGSVGLKMFESAHQEGKPFDLICLDIVMPEVNGREMLKQLRSFEQLQGIGGLDHTKIIMTTGQQDKENILGSFREGCEIYLIKPVEIEHIQKAVRKLGLAD